MGGFLLLQALSGQECVIVSCHSLKMAVTGTVALVWHSENRFYIINVDPPNTSIFFCYAFKDKTVFTNKHFSFFSFSFWLCFILTQTLSPGRTLCWAVICYHILHLMETSLFLLSPPPAPLLLLAPARDPVWRSCRLVRQLPVRPPPLS